MTLTMQNHQFSVLLAEDSEDDIHAIRRCWSEVAPNCKLQVVKDGRECLEYLFNQLDHGRKDGPPPPDLLLLDLSMPELDGFQVMTRLKQDPRLRRMPVVVLANNPSREEIGRVYDLGASAVFGKPSGQRKLTELLKTLVSFWNSAKLPDRYDVGAETRRPPLI